MILEQISVWTEKYYVFLGKAWVQIAHAKLQEYFFISEEDTHNEVQSLSRESIVVRMICQQKESLDPFSHKEEDVGLQRWSDSQALASVTVVSVN